MTLSRWFMSVSKVPLCIFSAPDLSPKSPPALRGVLGVKSLTSSGHLVHDPSLQEFHRCQVPNAECGLRQL